MPTRRLAVTIAAVCCLAVALAAQESAKPEPADPAAVSFMDYDPP